MGMYIVSAVVPGLLKSSAPIPVVTNLLEATGDSGFCLEVTPDRNYS